MSPRALANVHVFAPAISRTVTPWRAGPPRMLLRYSGARAEQRAADEARKLNVGGPVTARLIVPPHRGVVFRQAAGRRRGGPRPSGSRLPRAHPVAHGCGTTGSLTSAPNRALTRIRAGS